MTLTEAGESRVRGYLFVLGRSLRSFLPRDTALDAVHEVESHIRERIEQAEGGEAGERVIIERILAELGPPLRVAQAYSQEMMLDEAVTTGRFVPMARALWHLTTTSLVGFLWGLLVLIGWGTGLTFFAIAALKPIFPNNVGLIVMKEGAANADTTEVIKIGSALVNFGAQFPLPPGAEVHGGYWVIPISLVVGLAVIIGTHRASRRILAWIRSRKAHVRLRVHVEVKDQPQ